MSRPAKSAFETAAMIKARREGRLDPQQAGAERRAHPRLEARLPVRWRSGDEPWQYATASNVSVGGLQMQLPAQLRKSMVGREVTLRFPGPAEEQRLELTGEIRWVSNPSSAGSSFGVQLEPKDRGPSAA